MFHICPHEQNHLSSLRGDQSQRGQRMRGPEGSRLFSWSGSRSKTTEGSSERAHMLQYYDAGSLDRSGIPTLILFHASPVSLVSQTTSRCFIPWASRIIAQVRVPFLVLPPLVDVAVSAAPDPQASNRSSYRRFPTVCVSPDISSLGLPGAYRPLSRPRKAHRSASSDSLTGQPHIAA